MLLLLATAVVDWWEDVRLEESPSTKVFAIPASDHPDDDDDDPPPPPPTDERDREIIEEDDDDDERFLPP